MRRPTNALYASGWGGVLRLWRRLLHSQQAAGLRPRFRGSLNNSPFAWVAEEASREGDAHGRIASHRVLANRRDDRPCWRATNRAPARPKSSHLVQVVLNHLDKGRGIAGRVHEMNFLLGAREPDVERAALFRNVIGGRFRMREIAIHAEHED